MPQQTSNPPIRLALHGVGPRRWQVLGGGLEVQAWPQPENLALVLPAAKVQEQTELWLDGGRQDGRKVLEHLEKLRSWLQRGLAVAGHVGYEAGAALEGQRPAGPPLNRESPGGVPDLALFAFHPEDLQPVVLPSAGPDPAPPTLPDDLTRQGPAYRAAVAEALERIRAGEIYQANLTVACQVPMRTRDPLAVLAALQAVQPVPYAAVLVGEGWTIASGSMERFLAVAGQHVRSRPIKGTARRHTDRSTDLEVARELAKNPKERAENTMIVDMVRNDLQRACLRGSVRVPVLCQPEPYATLWHLESEVAGILRDPLDLPGLLRDALPPASVTGCPKIQAMKVIAELERRRRGPYCGTLGLALPDGRSDWSVAIRQAIFQGDQALVSVGAGIVAGSDPEREWQETCLKAQAALRWLARGQAGGG